MMLKTFLQICILQLAPASFKDRAKASGWKEVCSSEQWKSTFKSRSEYLHGSHRLFQAEFPSLLSQVRKPLGETEQLKQNTGKSICSNKSPSNKIIQKIFLKNTLINTHCLGSHLQLICLKSRFRHLATQHQGRYCCLVKGLNSLPSVQ